MLTSQKPVPVKISRKLRVLIAFCCAIFLSACEQLPPITINNHWNEFKVKVEVEDPNSPLLAATFRTEDFPELDWKWLIASQSQESFETPTSDPDNHGLTRLEMAGYEASGFYISKDNYISIFEAINRYQETLDVATFHEVGTVFGNEPGETIDLGLELYLDNAVEKCFRYEGATMACRIIAVKDNLQFQLVVIAKSALSIDEFGSLTQNIIDKVMPRFERLEAN